MELESLATLLTTTATSVNNDDYGETLSTTAVSVMSTATTHPSAVIDVRLSDNYINSLSDEQLVEFSNILEEREKDFSKLIEDVESLPKVYTKTNNNV